MKKYEILSAIEEALGGISLENNYLTNIGSDCTYWRSTDQEWQRSGVTYRDSSCQIIENNLYHEYLLSVDIEAIAFTDDPLAASCFIEADLIRAIGQDLQWGGKAVSTQVSEEGIVKSIETKGACVVGVTLNLLITFRVNKWAVE